MKVQLSFGFAVTLAILSSLPVGYFFVWLYIALFQGLKLENIHQFSGLGALISLALSGLGVLFIGVPYYIYFERKNRLTPTKFMVVGGMVALLAYWFVVRSIAGGTFVQVAIQAIFSTIIGACVAGTIIFLAPPNKSLEQSEID